MVDLESLAENFSLIYFLSSVILLLGLFFLVFPLLLRLVYTQRIKTFDTKTVVVLGIILVLVVASSQLVHYSTSHPKVLLPFVVISCGLKFASPAMMVKKMREKETSSERWQKKKGFLFLVSLAAAVYIIISTLSATAELSIVETLMTTFASAYGFSRIYLKMLLGYRRSSSEKGTWFHWLAGLFIGIAFIILIPFLVPEYAMIFKLCGGLGWFGAFSYLFVVEDEVEEAADGEGGMGVGQDGEAPADALSPSFRRTSITLNNNASSPLHPPDSREGGIRRVKIQDQSPFQRKKL